jgi:hypothetical protein
VSLEFSKADEHEAKHGQVDHGFASVGLSFVVATESPITSQPTEGTLYDPASRQHFECMKLGSFHDLDCAAANSPCPVHQRARIAAVGPDMFDAVAGPLAQRQRQQLLGGISILNIGGQHHHRDDQSDCIDQDVAFAPIDFLAGIVTPLVADLGAFDALAVDDTSTGVALASIDQAHLLAQVSMNGCPQTVALPESEVVIGRSPRGKVSWQVAPLATRFDHIENGVGQLSERMLARTSYLGGLGEAVVDELPFTVGKVRCISHPKRITDCSTTYKLTLKKSLDHFVESRSGAVA